jgi:acetyl-CoA carboxylase biotin carboxylase subunit
MERALEEFIIEGIHTTIPFHLQVMADYDFQSGNFDTKYVEHFFKKLKLTTPSGLAD